MSAPKISILLPSLNAREFLDARIESLLSQTFSEWEAIVLDSGSTDGSWEMFQSIASRDSRFRLHQIPREGLYAALNRGMQLATGEFLHIATCDDTMLPEFLTALLEAFAICPEAGIAASDLNLINRNGGQLTRQDMSDYLPAKSIRDLLALNVPRSYPASRKLNYRTPPHDCLIHFSAKSVYFSLTQLLIRTAAARANGLFNTTVGSIADFDWLVRLTNVTGTVHIPEKLATWRFHGEQLSIRADPSQLSALWRILERAATEVCRCHSSLLTDNDCAVLLLPCKRHLADSIAKRMQCWFEAALRSVRMLVERPWPTVSGMVATRFRPGNLRRTLIPMFMRRLRLAPEEIPQGPKVVGTSAFRRIGPSPT
jgi:glycosyltransferase involved in cell wall biosynthesis